MYITVLGLNILVVELVILFGSIWIALLLKLVYLIPLNTLYSNCKINDVHYNFICIYRPPNSPTSSFFDEFAQLLELISAFPAQTIISGDFNINIGTQTVVSKSYLDLLYGFNLSQHVNFITYLSGSILDHFITQSETTILKSINIIDCLSDHVCIKVCLSTPCQSQFSPEVSYHKLRKIDLKTFKLDLLKTDLVIHPKQTACDLYSQFHLTLTDLLDSHAPLITNRVDSFFG